MLTIPSDDWDIKQDAGTTDLLLIVYKRRPPRGDGIEVFGDTALLDFWLERVSFE